MDGKENPNRFPLIPPGEVKCIWMDAGLISFKLCDKNLDCDNCPLDRALRGAAGNGREEKRFPADSASSPLLEHLSQFQVDSRRSYHSGHTWVQVEGPGRARVGVDGFLSTVLGSIDSVTLPTPGEKVAFSAPFGEVIQAERCFSLSSPVGGTVREVNEDLFSCPNRVNVHPLGEGWLMVVESDNLEEDLRRCRTGKAVFLWYLKEIQWLDSVVTAETGHHRERLGRTLYDGGLVTRDLREMLPPDRYRFIILGLVSPLGGRNR